MPKQFLDPQGLSQFTENLEHSIIADEYDPTATYALGDYCVYENLLYRCISTISVAEAWTSAHWTQILIMNEVAASSADHLGFYLDENGGLCQVNEI